MIYVCLIWGMASSGCKHLSPVEAWTAQKLFSIPGRTACSCEVVISFGCLWWILRPNSTSVCSVGDISRQNACWGSVWMRSSSRKGSGTAGVGILELKQLQGRVMPQVQAGAPHLRTSVESGFHEGRACKRRRYHGDTRLQQQFGHMCQHWAC